MPTSLLERLRIRLDELAALDADPRAAGDGAGRLIFATLAPWIAGSLLTYYAVLYFSSRSEFAWVGGFHATAAVLFFCAGIAVRRRPTPSVLRWGARLVFVGLIAVMIAAFVFSREGFSLLWLAVVPMATIFILGVREGLIWSGATLSGWLFLFLQPDALQALDPDVPWPGPRLIRDFATAFVTLTLLSIAFEVLRIRTRRVLFEQRESLLQASRLESIGHLTSGVAHDFNNLLMVIQGNLGLVAQDAEDAGVELEGLDEARGAADRAAELTSKLLSYAGRQSLRPRPIAIETLFEGVLALLQSSVGQTVRITTRVSDPALTCLADRSQLESALINLALNARDAMPQGGTITIEARPIRQSRGADEPEIASGEYVRITVHDAGPGIPASIRSQVFEPFFSTKEPGAGTGLGLSMVQGFARQSGGEVSVLDSDVGGTTFALDLPAADPPADH